jgi:hypothetical protein
MNMKNYQPAFPVIGHLYDGVLGGQLNHGMTLRDYFAAKAMQALINKIEYNEADSITDVPEASYAIADAMIAERDK